MPSFHGGTKYWSETKGYYIGFFTKISLAFKLTLFK